MLAKEHKREPTTLRQFLSLCIWVVVVTGVFVLNFLSNEQWFVKTNAAQEVDSEVAVSLWESQSSRLLKGKNEKISAGMDGDKKTALKWSSEDLGLSETDDSVISQTDKQRQPLELYGHEQQLQERIASLLKSRNPCQLNSKSRGGLACLPSYYLAGFSKCGTTDLYRRLSAHPDIAFSPLKELHWITRERFASNASLENYKEFFGQALLHYASAGRNWSSLIAGDYSSSTLWDNRYWRRLPGNANCSEPRVITADIVRHLNPDAKVVIIVRNPSDRLYSEYMFFNRNATKEEFHRQVVEDTQSAMDCFQKHSVRWCIYNVLQEMTLRLHVGMYAVHIEDWLKRFPRDQIHVLRLEDLSLNPYKEVTSVYKFLNLKEANGEATLEAIKSPKVANVGHKLQQHGPMRPKTKKILDDFYRLFNKRLAWVLQNEKYLWSDF